MADGRHDRPPSRKITRRRTRCRWFALAVVDNPIKARCAWSKGLNIITLPKTIDNDVALTDSTFGFATALDIATRSYRPPAQHGSPSSPHYRRRSHGPPRGLADPGRRYRGGADVILIPEIPYDVGEIADAIKRRSGRGDEFQHRGRGRGRDEPGRRRRFRRGCETEGKRQNQNRTSACQNGINRAYRSAFRRHCIFKQLEASLKRA